MKKGFLGRAVFFAVLLAAFIGLPAFGQDNSQNANQEGSGEKKEKKYKESEYYPFQVPIEKIYLYKKGYIVVYRKGANRLARTYIPVDWFTNPDGKADLINLGSVKAWPYLTVYYKGGAFSHIRLYVRKEINHETWGVVPFNVDMDSYFNGVEEVKLEF